MEQMSSILISLTHFCDKHGPRVILVTQASSDDDMGEKLLVRDYPIDSYCESCLLHFPEEDSKGVRSMRTFVKGKTMVTTQYSAIRYQLLSSITKKSFSEEVMVYDSSPFVFYDDLRGLNLVMGFKLYDENARGNERRYSLTFTIDSRRHDISMDIISENWNFIISCFTKMIDYIKESHAKEIERQNSEGNGKNLNTFTPFVGNYLRGNKSKVARNLIELTNDKSLFIRIHKWNSFLISSLIMKSIK